MALAEIVPIGPRIQSETPPAPVPRPGSDVVFVDTGLHDIQTAATLGHHTPGNWPQARLILAVPADELAQYRAILAGDTAHEATL